MTTDRKFMEGADPSWYPRVLRTLERDYPGISNTVWSTAIGENAVEMVRKGQATTTVEEHPITGCADCGGPFQPGRLNGHRVNGRWVHHPCPNPDDPHPERERCILCPKRVGYRDNVFVDRGDAGWRGWAHVACWMQQLDIIPKQPAPEVERPIERCEHCDAPFTPDTPGRLNADMTRWRHMACPACWICKRPLGEPAGPMGLLPAEWVEMADSRAGMAHTACFEGIREDI